MFKIYDGRDKFWQWDIDRKLIVSDASISQVHFCNRTDECALVRNTYTENGLTLVDIPNVLLQEYWRINVYAYDKNYTKHSTQFEVEKRSKPDNYVYTEEELKTWEELEARIDALAAPDLSNYYTKAETDAAVNAAKPDLTGYALKTDIPSLDGYAKTTDIPDVSKFQTAEQVNAAIEAYVGTIENATY